MNILALETSGNSASICALSDQSILAKSEQPHPQRLRTASWLTPAIKSLLEQVGWRPTDVELLSLPVGPGSFTGLRIGITTAKVFAYAAEISLVGVETLEALAWQAATANDLGSLHVVLDAQRNELFVAEFHMASGQPICERSTRIVHQNDWLASLKCGCTVHGPGLAKLANSALPGVVVTDQATWRLDAATVGRLAHQKYLAGQRDDFWSLTPNYFRKSAAEEKAAKS